MSKEKPQKKEQLESLTKEDRLKLLKERKERGEVSEALYKELKQEIESLPNMTPAPEKTPAAPAVKPSKVKMPSMKKMPKPVLIGAVVAVVAILIIAGFFVMAGGDEKEEKKDSNVTIDTGELPTARKWSTTMTFSGSVSGGPAEFVPDERVPFPVNESAVAVHVLLTFSGASNDLDLQVEDADGKIVGTSGNAPGEAEEVNVTNRVTPGEWAALVDPFIAINVDYQLVITLYHEEGGVPSGGDGDLLYMLVKNYMDDDDDVVDDFEVPEDLDEVLIVFSGSISEGTFDLLLKDTNGDEVLEVVLEDEDSDEREIFAEAVPGDWEVLYSAEGCTGSIVLTVTGA